MIAVELFVAVLGASNYTYAEATRTQQVPDWIASHQRAFAFFGGVTAALVLDQLKSGVVVPCRYEPGLQRTYEEFAQHYGTVDPARAPGASRATRPRSRSPCRSPSAGSSPACATRRFFSLAALNARIAELLDRPERPADAPLPRQPPRALRAPRPARAPAAARRALRRTASGRRARVNIDYHVELHGHYYSVPYALVPRGRRRARLTATHRRDLPSRPARRAPIAAATAAAATPPTPPTCPRRISTIWSGRPSRFIGWAQHDRPADRRPRRGDPRRPAASRAGLPLVPRHPAPGQALRPGPARGRLRRAPARVGARSYRHVDSILKHGLDRSPLPAAAPQPRPAAPRTNTCAARDYYL